jgi:hypothetical protein
MSSASHFFVFSNALNGEEASVDDNVDDGVRFN